MYKISKKDLEIINNLIKTSTIEYGGTLIKKGNTFFIDQIYEGYEDGIQLNIKGKYMFHLHTHSSVKKNCGYNFPSLLDIKRIVDDTINHGVVAHIIFTPSKTFFIKSLRTTPIRISSKLLELEMDVCSKNVSISKFIETFRKEKVFIE